MGAAQLKSGKRSTRVRVAGGCWAARCSQADAFGFPVTLVSWCRSCGTGGPAGISAPRARTAAGATGCPLL